MMRAISVVDWDACRLGYGRDALVFAFKEVAVDIGDEKDTPAEVVELYDSALKMQKAHSAFQAVQIYTQVEAQAAACGNPVLALMAQHQRVLCSSVGYMVSRELALLLAYIPSVYEQLLAPTAHAVRLTVALEQFEELVRSNALLFKAQEEGRYAQSRLSAIEEMIAEGSYERAEYFARETARVLAEKLGEDHWWRAVLLLKQAECLNSLKKNDEARQVLKVCDGLFAEWCCSEEHPLYTFVHRFVALSRSVGS